MVNAAGAVVSLCNIVLVITIREQIAQRESTRLGSMTMNPEFRVQ